MDLQLFQFFPGLLHDGLSHGQGHHRCGIGQVLTQDQDAFRLFNIFQGIFTGLCFLEDLRGQHGQVMVAVGHASEEIFLTHQFFQGKVRFQRCPWGSDPGDIFLIFEKGSKLFKDLPDTGLLRFFTRFYWS